MLKLACCSPTGTCNTDSPCQAASCKRDATPPNLQVTRHLACPTRRHHPLPTPQANCTTSYTSPKPAFVNGYFCLSRARKGGTAKNRDRKTFRACDCCAAVAIAYMELFVWFSHFKNLSFPVTSATECRRCTVKSGTSYDGVFYLKGAQLRK
jgi:hypothetical protein